MAGHDFRLIGCNVGKFRFQNFGDLLMISGRYQVKPSLPFVPGCEVAGVVSAVGDNSDPFRVGDGLGARHLRFRNQQRTHPDGDDERGEELHVSKR